MGDVQVRGWGPGIKKMGKMSILSMEEMDKDYVQTFFNFFLKILTEGAVTTFATQGPRRWV